MSEQSLVFTSGMQRTLRQPVAIRLERRLRGYATCDDCGQPFLPERRAHPDRDDYMAGVDQPTCRRCQLQHWMRCDLQAAGVTARLRLVS